MSTVVFAGPSLFGVDRSPFDFDFRPPARCGDVLRAIWEGATTIGLIDGYFATTRSVWHKEILCALHADVDVAGAASIGALRAAECSSFGMRGVGRIFEQYAAGERVEDADVAVLHAPAELHYAPLTLALVDVEATVSLLVARDELPADLARELRAAARALHYRARTWAAVCERVELGIELQTILEDADISQKRADAIELLCNLKRSSGKVAGGRHTCPPISRTAYLAALERDPDSLRPE